MAGVGGRAGGEGTGASWNTGANTVGDGGGGGGGREGKDGGGALLAGGGGGAGAGKEEKGAGEGRRGRGGGGGRRSLFTCCSILRKMGWGVVGSRILGKGGLVGTGRRGRNTGSSCRLAVGKPLSAGSKPGTSGSKNPPLPTASDLSAGLSRTSLTAGWSLEVGCFLRVVSSFSRTSSVLSFSLKWSYFLPDRMGSL